MLCIAMDELEDATVRELSAQLDLERLQDLQRAFRSLQQNFVSNTRNISSPFSIDNNTRSFAVVDGLLAYASMKRIRRMLKCPTIEEVGSEDGFWYAQEKVAALNCKLSWIAKASLVGRTVTHNDLISISVHRHRSGRLRVSGKRHIEVDHAEKLLQRRRSVREDLPGITRDVNEYIQNVMLNRPTASEFAMPMPPAFPNGNNAAGMQSTLAENPSLSTTSTEICENMKMDEFLNWNG